LKHTNRTSCVSYKIIQYRVNTLYALYMHAHNVTVFTNVCIYSLQGDERVIYSLQGDDDGESVM